MVFDKTFLEKRVLPLLAYISLIVFLGMFVLIIRLGHKNELIYTLTLGIIANASTSLFWKKSKTSKITIYSILGLYIIFLIACLFNSIAIIEAT